MNKSGSSDLKVASIFDGGRFKNKQNQMSKRDYNLLYGPKTYTNSLVKSIQETKESAAKEYQECKIKNKAPNAQAKMGNSKSMMQIQK